MRFIIDKLAASAVGLGFAMALAALLFYVWYRRQS